MPQHTEVWHPVVFGLNDPDAAQQYYDASQGWSSAHIVELTGLNGGSEEATVFGPALPPDQALSDEQKNAIERAALFEAHAMGLPYNYPLYSGRLTEERASWLAHQLDVNHILDP